MRKPFFIKVIISLFFLFVLPLFIGCGKINFNTHAHTYISEYRKNLFMNKTGNMIVTFTSGEREKDYDLTGTKTPLVDFGVLTVKFFIEVGDILPTFELKIDDKDYIGQLERNPFDGSFVFDIEKQVDDEAEITLKLIDFEQNLKLVCVSSSWKTTWEDAAQIFSQKFNSEILKHTSEGKFLGEIYIKIVSDSKDLENIYWYVLCVCQDGNIYSCLIEPNSMEVVQSNK